METQTVRRPPGYAPPSPEAQVKLQQSAIEIDGLEMRDVKCPHCGYVITRVFADARGHFMARCRKCKEEYPINLSYFRRQKGIWRLKKKYYGEDCFEKTE